MLRCRKIYKLVLLVLVIYLSTQVFISFAAPGSSPDEDFPIFVTVDDTVNVDTFILSGHNDRLASGNWVELSGDGDQYAIPSISTSISLPLSTSYTVGSSDVDILSFTTSYSAIYPINVHSFYLQGDGITAKFWGDSSLANDPGLVWRLIEASQGDLVNAWEDLFNSDPSSLKNLVSSGNSVWESGPITLDGNGDSEQSFTSPAAGSYILVLVSESFSPYELAVYGITYVEVLDFDITFSNPSSVIVGNYVDVPINLVGGSTSTGFVYSVALVHDNAYNVDVDVVLNSATDMSISVNNEPVLESSGTVGNLELVFSDITSITALDKAEAAQKASDIFGSNNFAVGFSNTITSSSTTVSVSTNGLNIGNYRLLIGVYEVGDQRELVAFSETVVSVNPTNGGGGGGGGGAVGGGLIRPPLPEPWALELFSPEDAYDVCSQYDAEQVAEVLAEVDESLVLEILSLYNTSEAWSILKLLPQNMTISIILNMAEGPDRETVIAFLMMMTEEDSEILHNMIGNDFNTTIQIIDEAVKLLIENRDISEIPEVLSQLGALLMKLDEDVLMEICIGIAGLPSTPEITGVILSSFDATIRQGIISEWLVSGPLDLLISVFDTLDTEFLGDIYKGMTSLERLTVYPKLSSTAILSLPEIGDFVYSDLVINPLSGEPGQEFTMDITVINQGETDDYFAELWINGVREGSVRDILEVNMSHLLSFSTIKNTIGNYAVSIGGETGAFEIMIPEPEIVPATFIISAIVAVPNYVESGELFQVFITIANTGGEPGVFDAVLMIDGVSEDTREVPLEPGETRSIEFNVEKSLDIGVHGVSIGDKSTSLNVIEPPSSVSWIPIATISVILVVAAVGLYILRGDEIRGWINSRSSS